MLEIEFNTSFKGNLGTMFKDVDIVIDGLEANIKLDLKEVLNIHVNFKVGENSFTDLVDIIDIDEQLIKIPFRTDVIKKGVNEFELVTTMKDGSVKASQTYIYKVVDSLENPSAVESETNYPILIELLQDVEKTLEKTEETLEKAEEGLNKINEATESIDEIKDFIENSQLNNYATKDELPTKVSQLENDNKYISEIPSEYVTETELNNKGYLTEHQDISGKADKTELHSHSNKTVLDAITSVKVQSWDNKSTFSGDYNDLTNKPSIPTKVSQLTNDKGYITTIPSEYVTETELNNKGYLTEHQDISNKVDKVSGKGLSTNDYTTSEKNKLAGMEAGANNVKVYTAKECTTFTSDDGTCTPLAVQKAVGLFPPKAHEHSQYLTEHQDISGLATKEYVDNAITNLNIDIDYDSLLAFDTNEIITNSNYVDSDNNIILDDDLPSGIYTLKYEFEDGTYTDIKNFTIKNEPSGSVINLLEEGEIYLNKIFDRGNVSLKDYTGVVTIALPIDFDGKTQYTLKIHNSPRSLKTYKDFNMLVFTDVNMTTMSYVNGSAHFGYMNEGCWTVSDDGKSLGVCVFTPPANKEIMYLTLIITNGLTITEADLSGLLITLEKDGAN